MAGSFSSLHGSLLAWPCGFVFGPLFLAYDSLSRECVGVKVGESTEVICSGDGLGVSTDGDYRTNDLCWK